MTDKSSRQDDKCAACGIVRKQHGSNGEAYGVCGKFVDSDRQDGDSGTYNNFKTRIGTLFCNVVNGVNGVISSKCGELTIEREHNGSITLSKRAAELLTGIIQSPTRDGAEGAGEWRLLPVEPTEAMIEAGVKDHRHEQSFAGAEETYLAMVAAAPAPPLPAPDAMDARRAYSDWAFNKEGEAIGYMLPQQAAREAFFAGAKWWDAFSAPVPPADVIPRRPYIEDEPDGYLESDNCWIENNREAIIQFLEFAVARQAPHSSSETE